MRQNVAQCPSDYEDMLRRRLAHVVNRRIALENELSGLEAEEERARRALAAARRPDRSRLGRRAG